MTKIFIGNIHYNCTDEKFDNFCKTLEGCTSSKLIKKQYSKFCKGFGFIIFDNNENAQKIIGKEILLMDRPLKISSYKNPYFEHKIFIKNLKNDINYKLLYNNFKKFGEINNISININTDKVTAIISFKDKESIYKTLCDKIIIEGIELDIKIYKKFKSYTPQRNNDIFNKIYKNNNIAYQKGFEAGSVVGYQKGFQHGLSFFKN